MIIPTPVPKHDETREKREALINRYLSLRARGMASGRAIDVCVSETGYSFKTVYEYLKRARINMGDNQ